MANRNRYHVVPHPGPDPGWDIEPERAQGASGRHDHYDTKKEAIVHGREVAKPQGGQLIVHRRDGTIEVEYTYGPDPNPPRG